MEEFKKIVDELQRSVKSLQDQITSLKSGEVPSGAKTPGERSSPVQQVGDEVPTWAERMELETEAGNEIRRVKVREETELVLQKAFVPLKNQDRRALRRQYLVPDMPLTMAPKLDKVMAAECVPAVRSSDQTLARLQALVLDVVGPLTDLLERINRSVPSEGQEDEEEQGVDLQSIGNSVQSALAFLGNAATQFSAYRRTKILEVYNKDLVSFSEEVEPALRAAAPLLFGQSFTKQAADHLGQVEALRKVKGKGKKVFSRPPLQKQIRWQGGSKPYHRSYGQKGTSGQSTPKKPLEWQLTFQEPKAQIVEEPKAHISVMLSTQNVSIANPIMQKLHALGFTQVQRPACEQSTGGRKNVSLCHQLESNNPGPVGPSYGAGLPHSFQGGASSSARTSTMSVFRGTNEAFARPPCWGRGQW